MKFLRIVAVLLALVLFAWLNWRFLPDVAIVRFERIGQPIPDAGYLLVYNERSHFAGYRVIGFLKSGWSGVVAAWPYIIIGIICGVFPWIFMAKLTRIKYEAIARDAENGARSIIESVWAKENLINHKLLEIEEREKTVSKMFATAMLQQKKNEAARKEGEELRKILDEKLRHAESAANELKKAKSKIRRLEGKIGERIESIIDKT